MKKYLSVILALASLFSCKKQGEQSALPSNPVPPTYIPNAEGYLKNQVSAVDYASIDFTHAVLSKQAEGWYLRLGLLNKKISGDFIVLQTDSAGNGIAGKFVHIDNDSPGQKLYRGRIITESLQRTPSSRSITLNGITRTDCVSVAEEATDANACSLLVPACSNCLPEVLVVGYLNTNTGTPSGTAVSYSDYLSLSGLVNGIAGTTVGIASGIPEGGSAGNSTSGTGNGTLIAVYSPVIVTDPAGGSVVLPKPSADLTVNYEQSASRPAIDVNAFMKCFSTIPDEGATCSVTIYDDLPVDDDPSYIFNITNGATGHCFLQLSKTNGSQSASQFIGFTTSKLLALTGLPVPGKIVDNSGHKYNATFTMSLTPGQLATEIKTIIALGNNQSYAIWDYNCVNYALQVLNAVRSTNPLVPVLIGDPETGDKYSTPQGLYMTLEQMKKSGSAESKNITIDVVKNAGTGHGACN